MPRSLSAGLVKRAGLGVSFGFFALSLSVGFAPVLAQDPQDFEVERFEADYYLTRETDRSATLRVSETIVARFAQADQNHGILRAIPESYQGHTISLKILAVTGSDGRPWPYQTYSQNNNRVLKIGDPGRFIHGRQTFAISYQMRNVISFQNTRDEFFWDVNGDQWQQPFELVVARLHVPRQLANSLTPQQRCYAGYSGDTAQNCRIGRQMSERETVVTAEADNLEPGQALSLVVGFESQSFRPGPEIAAEQRSRTIRIIAAAAAVSLPPIAATCYLYNYWRRFGRDPKGRGVIIPQYEPPKNFNSLSGDYLMHENFRGVSLGALIVELAVGRYLSINEIKRRRRLRRDITDYELVLLKLPASKPASVTKALEIFFEQSPLKPGARVKLTELQRSVKPGRYKKIEHLGEMLASELTADGYFRAHPGKTRRRYQLYGGIVLGAGVLAGLLAGAGGFAPAGFLAAGLTLASLVVFMFAKDMPARTLSGVEAADHLLGLKEYIKTAEAQRLRFGQSPAGAEKTPLPGPDFSRPGARVKLFEGLLPFAILFGLEKDWAKQFEGLYQQPPEWYSGGSLKTFNTSYLAGSLNGFTAASTITFAPSGSSGGSGFSGGGAGGGGGGGGGGGW